MVVREATVRHNQPGISSFVRSLANREFIVNEVHRHIQIINVSQLYLFEQKPTEATIVSSSSGLLGVLVIHYHPPHWIGRRVSVFSVCTTIIR